MKTQLVTSSTAEAIDLEETKLWLRIEEGETAEDDLIQGLIEAARGKTEEYINRKLIPQKWYCYLDDWPDCNYITLPYPPLRSVPSTGIVYTNSTANSTTYGNSASTWASDTVSMPGRIVRQYNESAWPNETLATNNPIRIEFNCGYAGTTAVPPAIKTAMKLMIGHWYENREESIVGSMTISEIPMASRALLMPYRIYQF